MVASQASDKSETKRLVTLSQANFFCSGSSPDFTSISHSVIGGNNPRCVITENEPD
jgi:hypothetical protein